MKNQKGFIVPLLIVIVAFLVIGGGVYVYNQISVNKSKINTAELNPHRPKDSNIKNIAYNYNSFSFQYPVDWKVKKSLYLTPAAEDAGEAPAVIGLSLVQKDKVGDEDVISFDGRQIPTCDEMKSTRCINLFSQIYTTSKNTKVLAVFDNLIRSITRDTSKDQFIINFPQHNLSLEAGKIYDIKWTTNTRDKIENVDINVIDSSSNNWQKGLILSIKNVPNTGSYRWTVPTINSAGPFYVNIYHLEPTKTNPSSGTLASYKNYSGFSNPFYIGQNSPCCNP